LKKPSRSICKQDIVAIRASKSKGWKDRVPTRNFADMTDFNEERKHTRTVKKNPNYMQSE
jgi:hypothetical protein